VLRLVSFVLVWLVVIGDTTREKLEHQHRKGITLDGIRDLITRENRRVYLYDRPFYFMSVVKMSVVKMSVVKMRYN